MNENEEQVQQYIAGVTGSGGPDNYDGGNASENQTLLIVADGDASPILPPGGSADFLVDYAIIAINKTALRRVNLTFADFKFFLNLIAIRKLTEKSLAMSVYLTNNLR